MYIIHLVDHYDMGYSILTPLYHQNITLYNLSTFHTIHIICFVKPNHFKKQQFWSSPSAILSKIFDNYTSLSF